MIGGFTNLLYIIGQDTC